MAHHAVQLVLVLGKALDGGLELVAGHAGADDGQLPGVDHSLSDALLGGTEAHGDDGGPVGRNAHLQHGGEGAGIAGGVEDHIHTGAVGKLLNCVLQILRLGVDNGVGPVLLGPGQRGVVDVRADHPAALQLQGLEDHGADGSAAQDQHGLAALDAGAGGAVAADGKGLDQGRVLEGHVLGQEVHLVLGHGEVLPPAAVDGGAAGLDGAAHIAAALLALGALPAGHHQVHYHVVAYLDVLHILAHRHDDAGVLMAGDPGKHGVGVLPQELMDVGAAHTGRLHLNQHLAVARLGHRDFTDLVLLRAGNDDFLHGLFHCCLPPLFKNFRFRASVTGAGSWQLIKSPRSTPQISLSRRCICGTRGYPLVKDLHFALLYRLGPFQSTHILQYLYTRKQDAFINKSARLFLYKS